MKTFLFNDPENWTRDAACRGVGISATWDPFYPVATAGPAYERDVAQAKEICTGCPVRDICLANALEGRYGDGIAGGLTCQERDALRRRTISATIEELPKSA